MNPKVATGERAWRVGDVARVAKMEHPRVLILEISDRAYCRDEHGHACSWDLADLLTLPQWMAEVRALCLENKISAEREAGFLTAGSGDIAWRKLPPPPARPPVVMPRTGPIPLHQAEKLAAKVAEYYAPFCDRVAIAGSIRRKVAQVHDIDLVILPKLGQPPGTLALVTNKLAMIGGFLSNGEFSKRIHLAKSGVQLDVWIAHHGIPDMIAPTPSNWGAMLLTYTGSPAFNVRVLHRADSMGFRYVPGHGLRRGEEWIEAADEVAILDRLQMNVAPEGRV